MIIKWIPNIRRARMLRLLLGFVAVMSVFILYVEMTFPVRYIFKHSDVSSSCVIPHLDPFDPSILQFIWQPQPLVCDTSPAVVYADDAGVIQYNSSALKLLNLKESDIQCTKRVLIRNEDDNTVTFSINILVTPPFPAKADFFHVICNHASTGSKLMDMILTSTVRDRRKDKVPIEKETPQQLSVLLFGVDSVSRSAAVRKLPKTFRYLTEELQSYDFKGYMKVGENTLPNLVPLLTGLRSWTNELPHTDYAANPFDTFPLIWKNYTQKGYATMFAEDMLEFSTFNYLTRGFKEQPTSHYMRPFYIGAKQLAEMKTKLQPVFQFLENSNVNVQAGSSMCYKNKAKHMVQIDYLKQFMTTYKRERRFAFSFLADLAHEYHNFLSYGDDDFLAFFKWLKSNGHLVNTVLVFFSDHGSRIERMRNTFVGRMEDRMPMLQIFVPPSFKENYPSVDNSLKINTQRLATAFDLHQTLVDILHQNFEKPSTSAITRDNRPRGISFFQPIPEGRSCSDAWVPENYCACYTSHPVNITNNAIVSDISAKMVLNLNERLAHLRQCDTLVLNKVLDARKATYSLQHTATEAKGISLFQFMPPESQRSERYDLSIETIPGNGVFEGTWDVTRTSEFNLLGDIVRINKYGNQSKCIDDKRLQPLCYCKQYI